MAKTVRFVSKYCPSVAVMGLAVASARIQAGEPDARTAAAMAMANPQPRPAAAQMNAAAAMAMADVPPGIVCDDQVCRPVVVTAVKPERAAVRVVATGGKGGGFGSGTVVRTPAGPVILTARHVIDGAASVSVLMPDYRWFSAVVLATAPACDLAALSCPADVAGVEIGRDVSPGERVRMFGHPFGRPEQSPKAAMAGGPVVVTLYANHTGFDTGLSAESGDSGAGVFDTRGQVAGVLVCGTVGKCDGSAESVANIREFLDSIGQPKTAAAKAAKQRLTLVRYTAGWCKPCQAYLPTLQRPAVQAELARFDGYTSDLTSATEFPAGVTGLPLLVVTTADGTVVGRLEGQRSEAEVLAFLRSVGQ